MLIEQIKQHVLIDNTYPALIMNDGTIRIMVRFGVYYNQLQFETEVIAGRIPKTPEQIGELLDAFNKQY